MAGMFVLILIHGDRVRAAGPRRRRAGAGASAVLAGGGPAAACDGGSGSDFHAANGLKFVSRS